MSGRYKGIKRGREVYRGETGRGRQKEVGKGKGLGE